MNGSDPAAEPASRAIFVVGCPRSGTTLCQSLLGQNPAIKAYPETNILWYAAGDLDARRFGPENIGAWPRAQSRVKSALNARGIQFGQGARIRRRFKRFLDGIGRRDLAALLPRSFLRMEAVFETFMTVLDRAADGKMWAEKSPQNLFVLDLIQRYIGSPYVVHILREPKDNLASLRDAALKFKEFRDHRVTGPDGARNAVAYWNRALQYSAQVRGQPRHFFVRYEDLSEAPEPVMRELCAFLGVEFTAAMLEYSDQGVVKPHEKWKQGGGEIRRAKSKFEEVFTADERRLIESGVEDLDHYFPRRFS